MQYDHESVEKKWQQRWKDADLFRASDDSSKPKTYVLDMFPYPSGEGLHVGHPKGYIATDVYSRFMRMNGHTVLHPMGWDAFGLPAENYALKNKIHPRIAVEKNIATFKEQLSHIGFDYDWSREINTTDPAFYKWTQWIFLQLFKKGLAYQSNEPINWCPSCMTGLANEDLDGTVCERCGMEVVKKALPQWVLKITAYADRMLEDLDALEWPDSIKEAQRNWIGKSEGAEINFSIKGTSPNMPVIASVPVFTTRPDTLFGATYLILAPEHLLLETLKSSITNWDDVYRYIGIATTKSEIDRTNITKKKTGVRLEGIEATNPATKEPIPVFIADYVLAHYGTGAIMAVPAHDERDLEFAKMMHTPIKFVIDPTTGTPQENPSPKEKIVAIVEHDDTVLTINWKPELGGRLTVGGTVDEGEDPVVAAQREIAEETGYTDLALIEIAPEKVHHEYFAHSKNKATIAHTTLLHFRAKSLAKVEPNLEEDEKGKFTPEWIPKAQALQEIKDPLHVYALERFLLGKAYGGEGILINSGQFDGLRSEDAKQKITEFVGGKLVSTYKIKDWVFSRQRYWGEPIPIIHCEKDGAVPVPEDQLPVLLPEVESYEPSGTGESPLANIAEWVNTTCPTCGGPAKRETNTMPQWAGSSWYYLRFMDPHNDSAPVSKESEKYWGPVDVYVGGDHAVRHLIYARFWHKFLYDIGIVSTIEPFSRLEFLGFILAEDGRKMSKRYGNVINPTDVIKEYGADAFRVYEMFMGPFENTVAWSTASIAGTTRFIKRIFMCAQILDDGDVPGVETLLHQTIKKVTSDIEAFKFNTAVSQLMILLNAFEKEGVVGRKQFATFLQLLAPLAPHITEELWELLGNTTSIHTSVWPKADESKLVAHEVAIGVQVNGKVRGTVHLSPEASEAEALEAGRTAEGVAKWLEAGREVKAVYVPGRIVSFVVEPKTP